MSGPRPVGNYHVKQPPVHLSHTSAYPVHAPVKQPPAPPMAQQLHPHTMPVYATPHKVGVVAPTVLTKPCPPVAHYPMPPVFTGQSGSNAAAFYPAPQPPQYIVVELVPEPPLSLQGKMSAPIPVTGKVPSPYVAPAPLSQTGVVAKGVPTYPHRF